MKQGETQLYAGADWIEQARKHWKKQEGPMSPLGKNVANLLGDLLEGIYHLKSSTLEKVEWSNDHYITVNIPWRCLCTFDDNLLTILVVLCHDRCLRCEVHAVRVNVLQLMFHQRERTGRFDHRHPTIEDQIKNIREVYGDPAL